MNIMTGQDTACSLHIEWQRQKHGDWNKWRISNHREERVDLFWFDLIWSDLIYFYSHDIPSFYLISSSFICFILFHFIWYYLLFSNFVTGIVAIQFTIFIFWNNFVVIFLLDVINRIDYFKYSIFLTFLCCALLNVEKSVYCLSVCLSVCHETLPHP